MPWSPAPLPPRAAAPLPSPPIYVLIIGGGMGDLTAGLALHAAGIDATVFEAAEAVRPLGVGINLQPHAVRDLTALGLDPAVLNDRASWSPPAPSH